MPGLKTIYGQDGYAIADIRASVIRSSLLNDIGEAVFLIAVTDIKCREEILQYGNYILCRHNKLGDWVGIIDTPRLWKNGYVEVHAYEPEFLLQYRLPSLNIKLSGAPGQKITELLRVANSKTDTLIRPGEIDVSGASYEEVLTDPVYTHIKNIAEIYGFDWTCEPTVDASGRLTIQFNWLISGGIPSDLELSQGHNIMYGDTPLEESGELLSSVEGVSTIEGAEGANQILASYNQSKTFGLREARISFDGIAAQSALLYNCTQTVINKSKPIYGTPLTVLDVGSTFSNIRLRNIAKYKYTNVGFFGSGIGFEGNVRIDGFLYDENIGTCELFTSRI